MLASCRNPSNSPELSSTLSSLGLPPALALDIGDDASVITARNAVEEKYGTIDVLVNNAGKYRCTMKQQ